MSAMCECGHDEMRHEDIGVGPCDNCACRRFKRRAASVVVRDSEERLTEEERKPVMALRDDSAGKLDDVVVKNPTMFRAEMMDGKTLWMACYFDDAADERVTFHVRSKRGPLEFSTTETPSVWEDFDERGASVSRSPSSPPCEFCKRSTEDNCETADDLAHCAYAPSSTDAPGIGNRLSPSSPAPSAEERERDEIEDALEFARAPTESGSVTLSPAGRIRALYGRERIDANRQRARVSELEKALEEIRDRTRQDQPALGAAERAHHVARRALLSNTEGGSDER